MNGPRFFVPADKIAALEAQLARARNIIEKQRGALERISGQAVCLNMDGDDGNERMLRNIATMSEAALALTLDEKP